MLDEIKMLQSSIIFYTASSERINHLTFGVNLVHLICRSVLPVCKVFGSNKRRATNKTPKRGERSATVSEADYEADSSTVAEHDISTDFFCHTGSEYIYSEKVVHTYIHRHIVCFITSTNIPHQKAGD